MPLAVKKPKAVPAPTPTATPAPATAPPPEPEPVAEPPAAEATEGEENMATEEPDDMAAVDSMLAELQAEMTKRFKDIRARFKTGLKVHNKLIRKKKGSRAKKAGGGDRPPSGFARPCLLSNALASFIGVSPGTRVPRTDVTKTLNAYVKMRDLHNPENKREVVLDETLSNLTNLDKGTVISLFGMQTHLKQHYLPEPEAPAVPAAA
jgi:chromatin remodeling complex protein RSC6